jgi:uncharacterized membrane protein
MNLSDLYKNNTLQLEKVTYRGCDFSVKLFTEKEVDELLEKEIHDQLAMCIYEDGKSLKEKGCAEDIKNNMPLAHEKELMELIMKANGIGVTFEDTKKN